MERTTAERAHLVHVFPTFVAGGPQVRTAELIARLPDRFEHSIFAMDGRYDCRKRVPADRVRSWLEYHPGRGPLVPLRLARFVLAQKPDLVLTYNWGAIETVIGCRLRRFPAVLHHEDGFGPDETGGQKRRRVVTRRLVLRRLPAMVVPSRNLQRIAREVWRLPERLVHHVPNGVDTEHFRPGDRGAARRALGLPEDAVIIGSVGHLRGEKNYGLLVRTFAKLDPDVHLVLVGDGPERADLEEVARSLGVADRVHFTGTVEDTRIAYHAFDVFTLSSSTEQMPISILEAMACRCPVASTDVGDVRAMVGEPSRELVVPPERYEDALRRLSGDADLRRRIGEANRAHCAETHPLAKMVDTYERLYEAVMSR